MTTYEPPPNGGPTILPGQLSIWSAEDIPAPHSAKQHEAETPPPTCGHTCETSSNNSDPNMCCSRTSQPISVEDSPEFSLTSMPSGSMRNGQLSPHAPWVPHTHDADCSLLPTPTATANQCSPSMQKWPGPRRLQKIVGTGGTPPPTTFERMQGFPIGWTVCEPSGMP